MALCLLIAFVGFLALVAGNAHIQGVRIREEAKTAREMYAHGRSHDYHSVPANYFDKSQPSRVIGTTVDAQPVTALPVVSNVVSIDSGRVVQSVVDYPVLGDAVINDPVAAAIRLVEGIPDEEAIDTASAIASIEPSIEAEAPSAETLAAQAAEAARELRRKRNSEQYERMVAEEST